VAGSLSHTKPVLKNVRKKRKTGKLDTVKRWSKNNREEWQLNLEKRDTTFLKKLKKQGTKQMLLVQ